MKQFALRLAYVAALVLPLAVPSAAQEANATRNASLPDSYEKKIYFEQNGTQTLTRTVETEHHVTSDGEVEIQRYRAPAWAGDDTVKWEREIRTKRRPDGTVEKEDVVRRADAARRLQPVEMIREKTTVGTDSKLVERETLRPSGDGVWQSVRKETITEEGPDTAKEIVKRVLQPNTRDKWQIVERESSSTRKSTVGNATETQTQSVSRVPDTYGRFSDFERRQERTVVSGGKESHEVTAYLRDNSILDSRPFLLLDHSISETTTDGATTTRHVVRESDLLYGNSGLDRHSQPQIVEEQTVVEGTTPDGGKRTVTEVSGRTAVNPTVLRPVYTVVEESDQAGYARRIFIPAR